MPSDSQITLFKGSKRGFLRLFPPSSFWLRTASSVPGIRPHQVFRLLLRAGPSQLAFQQKPQLFFGPFIL